MQKLTTLVFSLMIAMFLNQNAFGKEAFTFKAAGQKVNVIVCKRYAAIKGGSLDLPKALESMNNELLSSQPISFEGGPENSRVVVESASAPTIFGSQLCVTVFGTLIITQATN